MRSTESNASTIPHRHRSGIQQARARFTAKITSHGFPKTKLAPPSSLEGLTPGSWSHSFLGKPAEGGMKHHLNFVNCTWSTPEPRAGHGRLSTGSAGGIFFRLDGTLWTPPRWQKYSMSLEGFERRSEVGWMHLDYFVLSAWLTDSPCPWHLCQAGSRAERWALGCGDI